VCNYLVYHFNLQSMKGKFLIKKEREREKSVSWTFIAQASRKEVIVHTSSVAWQRSATSSIVNGSTGCLQLKSQRNVIAISKRKTTSNKVKKKAQRLEVI